MKKFLSNPASLIFGGILIALFIYLIFAEKGILKRINLEIERAKLKKEIELIEKENASLRQKIHELETNPKAVEKIAREKYGMAKEGEEVFKIKVK
ncbi:Septum formation initiator [Candidatus Kryptobacter tengchongensis]|nr:Septum formation initiator [Candidatus Kryptobacter tengchongensis]